MTAPASTLSERPATSVVVPPWLEATTACAGLAAAAHFVTGFAVGHSFRVPRLVGLATRFVHDPLAALVMGVLAAVSTAFLVRFALRSERAPLGVLACALGGAIAGVLNALVSITILTALLAGMGLVPAVTASAKTIQSGLYMIPPGAYWIAPTLVLAYVGRQWLRQGEAGIVRAVWGGAILLLSHAEMTLVVLGPGLWPRVMGVLGVVAGLGCLGWAATTMVASARAAPASDAGASEARASIGTLAVHTAMALGAAQLWVGAIWSVWRR